VRPRDDDATLVARLQAGDEQAFAAIFKRHHGPLLSYCRHMLGNRDEGEDALQQALIKAHQALLGGTQPRELRPWLYAIARNCCLSAIATRRPTASLEAHTPGLAGLSEEVRQREDLRELLAAIGRLPEQQRSALLLAELDDLNHQAIATIVGCPVNKVKALVYQARSALVADRDARETPCQDIREQLSTARGGELRRGPLRRHLNLCAGCRDFQLAVGAQRQSLAAALPVLPSAGLAAAILGHGTAHVVGAASAGGAGAGLAPASGAAGAGVGVTATGATAAGGSGVAATGTATATTAAGAGAGAGGGASVGALVGGGLVTKVAVGGAVMALAAAGVAAAHRRPRHATTTRAPHGRLASFEASRGDAVDIDYTNGGPDAPSPAAPIALPGPTGVADPVSPELATAPVSAGTATTLLTLAGTSPSSPMLAVVPAPPAANAGQARSAEASPPAVRKTRAKLRRATLRRHARQLRKARLRARRRVALREALRRRQAAKAKRQAAKSKTPKTPKAPVSAVTSAPVRTPHRKARPDTVSPGSSATGTTGGESKEDDRTEKRHHRTAADTGSESAGVTSSDSETSTTPSTGKGKRKAASGKGTESSGSGVGTGKAHSGAGAREAHSGVGTREAQSGVGAGEAGSDTGTGAAGSGAAAGKPSSAPKGKVVGSQPGAGKTDSEAGAGGAGRAGDSGGAGDATESGDANGSSDATESAGSTEPGDAASRTSTTSGAGARSRTGAAPPQRTHLVEEAQLPNL
jgi:RNA polymerase sigma factor (sigma-70 family)